MSRANDAAFPIPHSNEAGSYPAEPGMTLREYYAGLAMQGLLQHNVGCSVGYVVMVAVQHADALIAELAKEKA
jgi:hypothetical protein